MQIMQGCPTDLEGRNENEIAIYKFLEQLDIYFSRVDHAAVQTIEDCFAIDELLAPAKHCKNLLLTPTNKSKYYLLLIEETKKFNSGRISKQANSSRLQFCNDEELEHYLGVKPGAVGALSLLADKDNQVQLLVDEDLLSTEYIIGHPGVNTASVALKTNDLFNVYLKALKHDYIIVKC